MTSALIEAVEDDYKRQVIGQATVTISRQKYNFLKRHHAEQQEKLKEVKRLLEIYQNVDDEAVRFTKGLNAKATDIDDKSFARKAIALLDTLIEQKEGV